MPSLDIIDMSGWQIKLIDTCAQTNGKPAPAEIAGTGFPI